MNQQASEEVPNTPKMTNLNISWALRSLGILLLSYTLHLKQWGSQHFIALPL